MNKLDKDIKDIESFLSTLSFDSSGFSQQHQSALRSTYKQFHASLVWSWIVERFPKNESALKLYYRECISDLSHSFLLCFMHLYKPSRMILRSSIENLLRSLLLTRNVDAEKIITVHELFSSARVSFTGEAPMEEHLQKLASVYEDLCKVVHSGKIDYMALSVPLEELPIFVGSRHTETLNSIRKIALSINHMAFWSWSEKLKTAGHRNEDLVLDAIPRTLKRQVSAKHS